MTERIRITPSYSHTTFPLHISGPQYSENIPYYRVIVGDDIGDKVATLTYPELCMLYVQLGYVVDDDAEIIQGEQLARKAANLDTAILYIRKQIAFLESSQLIDKDIDLGAFYRRDLQTLKMMLEQLMKGIRT